MINDHKYDKTDDIFKALDLYFERKAPILKHLLNTYNKFLFDDVKPVNNISIPTIPLMVKSKSCKITKYKRCESEYDSGSYFIFKDLVIIPQDETCNKQSRTNKRKNQ